MYNVFDKNGFKTHVHAHDRNVSVKFKQKITYNVKNCNERGMPQNR
jgi:hypothetical protein